MVPDIINRSIRIKNMDQRHKHLMEGLSSIQEIYILRKSLFFLGNFVKHSKKYLNANIKFHTTLSANRPIFEFVGILTLTALTTLPIMHLHTLTYDCDCNTIAK